MSWLKIKNVRIKTENDTKFDEKQILEEHRYDEGNIVLGYNSISLVDGHAGTDAVYYSAFRQVIVHSYCVRSGCETKNEIERIPIPEDMALRHSSSEILEYAKGKNVMLSTICR